MPDVRIIPASGSLQFTGSSAADSIHVQYTNSGLNFTSGSTNLMIVSSSGNVGIGTTNPGAKLEVASPSSGTTMLVGRANGNSSIKALPSEGGYLALDSSGIATIINHYSSDNVWLATGGGNVLVGAVSSNGSKLQVKGSGATSATTALLVQNANTSASLSVLDNGNVGIGTTTPGRPLNIVNNNPQIRISDTIAPSTNYWELYSTFGYTNQDLSIRNQNGNALTINESGNVGIGKTTPNAKLDVSGSAIITGSLTVTGGITGSITSAATASKIISNGGLNGGNHYFYISTYPPAGGNVGVIQTSNLIYNSSTNTLPTTSSWATSSMSSSYVNTLVQGVVITGSLNVTAGITGSLLGTASYATQALSASWAPGGGGSSFPYTGSAQITGSLVVTGDINVTGYSGFGTNTPTVRLEVNSGDNSLMRALKVRNTGSGSAAAAVMDFKTTDNDEFSIGQFNGASGGVYNAGDVFLQNNSTTGGLSNMYIGNAGNNNRMVISHTNTVGIGFPIGSVSSTLFGVYGSADIINDLSVGSSGGNLLLENGAALRGKDGAGNTILNFDGGTLPTLILGPDSGITLLDTSTIGGITEIIDQGTFEGDYLGSPSAQGSILSRAESGEAFTTGQLLFLSSSNQWYIADADAVATSTPLLGIALKDAGAANDLIAVLLEGHYSTDAYHDQVATPATPGSPLYISTTAGNVTETAPTSTGDVVRLIGHNIYGGAGGRGPDVAVIRFKPDNTWIEL